MKDHQSLARTRLDCRYHVVFIFKKGKEERIFAVLRKHLGEIFFELAGHQEAKTIEGYIVVDHVHI